MREQDVDSIARLLDGVERVHHALQLVVLKGKSHARGVTSGGADLMMIPKW